jgi:hypothetical protein
MAILLSIEIGRPRRKTTSGKGNMGFDFQKEILYRLDRESCSTARRIEEGTD